MKRAVFILLLIISVGFPSVNCQVNASNASQLLEKLYGRMIDNYNDADRLRINDSIRLIIDSYSASDTVFNHRFTRLRYLGQITSPDSLLKIITWNLILQNGTNKYFCYFIRRSAPGKECRVYRLTGNYREEPVRTDTVYSEPDWYGALYYDIHPFRIDNSVYYLLLGIDYGNSFITRKIIDVLSFTEDNRIIFGRKCFLAGDEKKYREVFEYGSNAVMSLRFISEKSIVFDHLVPFSAVFKDDHQYYGPDYTYDAYNFENGFWKLTINVDVRNKE